MRLFTPLALAVGAAALGYGMIAASAAQAVAPQQAAAITFTCAVAGPVPLIWPPWVNGRECTPTSIDRFEDVKIVFPDDGTWTCRIAESRSANPGFVDVLGKDCQRMDD